MSWFVIAITAPLSQACYFQCLPPVRPASLRSLCFPGEIWDSPPFPLQQCCQEIWDHALLNNCHAAPQMLTR